MSVTPSPEPMNVFAGDIPLTTIFTPTYTCSDPETLRERAWSSYPLGGGTSFTPRAGCYPYSSFLIYQYVSQSYFSPGVCPHSWDYVATSVQSPGPGGAPITLAVCCPPGIGTWLGPETFWCDHTLQSSDTTGVLGPLFSPSFTSLIGQTILGAPVSVAWQESDLSRFDPESAPVLDLQRVGLLTSSSSSSKNTASAGNAASTKTPSNTSGSNSSKGHSSSSLSTGAAAGIGVGSTVLLIAIIVSLWIFCRRYKFTRRAHTYEPPPAQFEHDSTFYMSPSTQHEYYSKHRSYTSPSVAEIDMAEAHFIGRPVEADSRTRSPELVGDIPEARNSVHSDA